VAIAGALRLTPSRHQISSWTIERVRIATGRRSGAPYLVVMRHSDRCVSFGPRLLGRPRTGWALMATIPPLRSLPSHWRITERWQPNALIATSGRLPSRTIRSAAGWLISAKVARDRVRPFRFPIPSGHPRSRPTWDRLTITQGHLTLRRPASREPPLTPGVARWGTGRSRPRTPVRGPVRCWGTRTRRPAGRA